MAIFKVNKTKDYTVISNYHFREKGMSLKAKGLLSQMLALPDDWNYSIAGLVAINKENEVSIKNALKELQEFNYLKVTKLLPNQTKTGRIEYIYDIYEQPYKKQEVEKQGVDFLGVEFLGVENIGQYNTNIYNTKELNTNNKDIIEVKEKLDKKETYGKYGRIKLTAKEYLKLIDEFGKEYIDNQIDLLDEYVESNNNKNKYSNFNLVLRRSIRENWFKNKKIESGGSSNVFLDIMKEDYESYRSNN